MTYRGIRIYAHLAAVQFARLTNAGEGAAAVAVEDAVIEKCGEALGGLTWCRSGEPLPSVFKRQQFLAKQFTVECRKRGLSTRVIHLAKNGDV